MEWTEERIAELRRLWAEGKSASQIAEIMGGVTRNAVIGKAHRLALDGRPSPIKRDPEAPVKPRRKRVKEPEAGRGAVLFDLTERMCRWPNGHPGDPAFHFCGQRTVQGMPYCEAHARVAYQAVPSRQQREAEALQRKKLAG